LVSHSFPTRRSSDLLTTINPNSYPFTDLIRKSSIIPIILSVPGVQYVQDLTLDWEETDVEYTVDTDGNLEIPYKGVLPNIQETNIVVNLILGT
jgi:protein involved in polysaccharide export with SLBB domain